MKQLILNLSFLALFPAFVACGGSSIQRDGFVVEADGWQDTEDELGRRASFDLSCPRNELSLTLLDVHDDAGADMPKQVGVKGCGQRATYTREFVGSLVSGWHLDGSTAPSK